MRIAKKVNPREVVCDMFCGVGPFSIMIAKYSEAEKIYDGASQFIKSVENSIR